MPITFSFKNDPLKDAESKVAKVVVIVLFTASNLALIYGTPPPIKFLKFLPGAEKVV